jgi:YD repeat-containing protein
VAGRGDLSALPIREQRRDERGRVVQRVDAGGGRTLEVLRDPMGRLLSARALPDGR